MNAPVDIHSYVLAAARRGELVVQPRLGVPDPHDMAARLATIAALPFPVVGTLTVDSYTRVGDAARARHAWQSGAPLNGFPLVSHSPEVVRSVVAAAQNVIPVQVRHGSADPREVLRAAKANGLLASEGGPVSYCLPYSRMPLATAVEHWRSAAHDFAAPTNAGGRPHLESFGGCMLGQLCPPSLLVALSVLECLFFEQAGLRSMSLSYAEQGHGPQDTAAVAALRVLATRYLSPDTAWHIVQYTYMGVFPRTREGAIRLIADSARNARAGGADRLIVKTVAEAHRLPTLSENISALSIASRAASLAQPATVDPAELEVITTEARSLIDAVLALHDDVGYALVRAFEAGLLDVPYCLHPDNAGAARSTVDPDGRVVWAETGAMPLSRRTTAAPLTHHTLMAMLNRVQNKFDLPEDTHHVVFVGGGPRTLSVLERLAALSRSRFHDFPALRITVVEPYDVGSGRIWRTNQPANLLMNTVCQEVTMFSGPPTGERDEPGSGSSLAQWWKSASPGTYPGGNGYAPRSLYGQYLNHVADVTIGALGQTAQVEHERTTVDDITKGERTHAWTVHLADGRALQADSVVLATGHPRALSVDNPDDLALDIRPGRYHGDSAADIPLGQIQAGETVALLGMGLSFYDLVTLLTSARGGTFSPVSGDPAGQLVYTPSGREPLIWGISRSGLPMPARGMNQKNAEASYRPTVFTIDRVETITSLDDLEQLLLAEVHLHYYRRHLARVLASWRAEGATQGSAGRDGLAPETARRGLTEDATAELTRWAAKVTGDGPTGAPTPAQIRERAQQLVDRACSNPIERPATMPPTFTLADHARPFAGSTFPTLDQWEATIRQRVVVTA